MERKAGVLVLRGPISHEWETSECSLSVPFPNLRILLSPCPHLCVKQVACEACLWTLHRALGAELLNAGPLRNFRGAVRSLRRKGRILNACSCSLWAEQLFMSINAVDASEMSLNSIPCRCKWHEENEILCCALASCKKIAWVLLRSSLPRVDFLLCCRGSVSALAALTACSAVVLGLEFHWFPPPPRFRCVCSLHCLYGAAGCSQSQHLDVMSLLWW